MRLITPARERPPYVPTSVNLDRALVERARSHGINISELCREALKTAVKAMETGKRQNLEMDP